MIIAVHQPQYLPWLGYFDKMDLADAFVLLDNVQYKKNEWQNRNRIKTATGWQWLTVPVCYNFPEAVGQVKINCRVNWQHKQRQAIISNYRQAEFFEYGANFLSDLFDRTWSNLAQVNIFTVKKLARLLNIDTPIWIASELGVFSDDPDERLIQVVQQLGGDSYLAGAGGHNYMDLSKYERSGIEIIFQQFNHPQYSQLFNGFEPCLSILDLILNHGPKSLQIIRGGRNEHFGYRRPS
ncbi:MAG: WbqC family protein [Candidatus Schekmanbacteria bacterium]|nr:WbqC family protein [Candidatus Schekmanbacteria bacterium]